MNTMHPQQTTKRHRIPAGRPKECRMVSTYPRPREALRSSQTAGQGGFTFQRATLSGSAAEQGRVKSEEIFTFESGQGATR